MNLALQIKRGMFAEVYKYKNVYSLAADFRASLYPHY